MAVELKRDAYQQAGLQQPTITVIYDDCSHDVSLKNGFGFSCLIEWEGRKILFDSGGDRNAFFSNIRKQKIALEAISHVVFSHEHWDHTAAFDEILVGLKDKTPIHIPSTFSSALIKKAPKIVTFRKMDGFTQIDENIYSLVLTRKTWCGLSSIQEQSLILDTPKGLIILTGCAHPGIINIIQTAQEKLPRKRVHLVMGGFHLRRNFCCRISKVIQQFRELDVEKVAPCHCAGERAIELFEDTYENNFIRIGTGSVVR